MAIWGNGAEPWKIKKTEDLASIDPPVVEANQEDWQPYLRDAEKLSRGWALPGTEGLEHRIGGLEKQDITGAVSYDPINHQRMVDLRAEKVARVADFIPELEVHGCHEGDLLVVGWGGTFGHLYTAVDNLNHKGKKVGLAHFNYMNPLPQEYC